MTFITLPIGFALAHYLIQGPATQGGSQKLPATAPKQDPPPKQDPAAAPKQDQKDDPPDTHPPAVTGGTPTVTDQATVSTPGWLEFDPGVLKDLQRDSLFGTPFTFKYTTKNNRLQYLLGSDGFVRVDSTTNGVGDTYPGLHYVFFDQQKVGFDVAVKTILKVPTAPKSLGGTARSDYSAFILASRDFTKWGFHGDFNVGLSQLSRQDAPGYDKQFMISGSTTTPIPGGRWQYTNELVYFSGFAGQDYHLTTMNGFSYAVHRYAVYSVGLQTALHGDLPKYQLLFSASFNIGPIHSAGDQSK